MRKWAMLGMFVLGCNAEPLDVAPAVDLKQVEGKWYEVAHLARATQVECTGTTATYTRRSDGTFSFVHECTTPSGAYRGSTSVAKVVDQATPAKLEVDFGGYIGEYWIIEAASDYHYMVVGHPSRDYLWIMSRTPSLSAEDMNMATLHAREKKFDTTRLEFTTRAADPIGTPAPIKTYGCSAASSSAASPSFLFGLVAAFALFSSARARARSKQAPT
jgi:apolipoprotein D and lipocalin family protein